MKTPHTNDLFKQDNEQSVRVIKAAQANKALGGAAGGHVHAPTEGQRKPEIRLIQTGADYCDLEIVCACGESTQVRCWNTPAAQAAAA
jgi:hypothetical protein